MFYVLPPRKGFYINPRNILNRDCRKRCEDRRGNQFGCVQYFKRVTTNMINLLEIVIVQYQVKKWYWKILMLRPKTLDCNCARRSSRPDKAGYIFYQSYILGVCIVLNSSPNHNQQATLGRSKMTSYTFPNMQFLGRLPSKSPFLFLSPA